MTIHLEDNGRHIEALARRVRALQAGADQSSAAEDYDELLRIIHFPGYTTPVQLLLVQALLEAAESNVVQGVRIRNALIAGSKGIIEEYAQIAVGA